GPAKAEPAKFSSDSRLSRGTIHQALAGSCGSEGRIQATPNESGKRADADLRAGPPDRKRAAGGNRPGADSKNRVRSAFAGPSPPPGGPRRVPLTFQPATPPAAGLRRLNR